MRLLLLFILLIGINTAKSQNLVPNPSFEDTINCPMLAGQIDYASGWQSITGTPDYFNACAQGSLNVPNTGAGFQNAFQGFGIAGALTFSLIAPNFREYFGIQLLQPLVPGQTYYGSLKVSMADNSGVDCAINKIGMKLTTYAINGPISADSLIKNDSKIYSTNIINDKINWIEIKGSFVADSAYEYILLGNFFLDQNTSTFNCITHSYYFFDSICLSIDSLDCFSNTSSISIPDNDLFSLNHDINDKEIVIKYKGNKNMQLSIVNAEGKLINIYTFNSDFKISTDKWSTGMYLINSSIHKLTHKILIINN